MRRATPGETRPQSTERDALLLLVVGALLISYAPIFVKWIGEARLGPTSIGFWRTLFGAATLFLLTLLRRRPLRLSSRLTKYAVLAGFGFSLDLFVWHRSVLYCGAGMSTILGNTQVFATALASTLLFKERLTLRYFLSAFSALLGVVLLVGLFSREVVFSERYLRGVFFGLATGLAYANYLVTLKFATRREGIADVVTFMAWTSLASAFFMGVTASFEAAPLWPPDGQSIALLVALGVVAQAFGWWSITTGLKRVQASRAGLILLLQPTLAMVWGVVYFAEQFTLVQLVGAIITLVAIYFGGLRKA